MIRRREFIAGLGAATWPLLVQAQQPVSCDIDDLATSV
jgi:hypothetical protein